MDFIPALTNVFASSSPYGRDFYYMFRPAMFLIMGLLLGGYAIAIIIGLIKQSIDKAADGIKEHIN